MKEDAQVYNYPQGGNPLKFYANKLTAGYNPELEEYKGLEINNTPVEVPGNMVISFSYDAVQLRDICNLSFFFKGLKTQYRITLSNEFIYPENAFEIYQEVCTQFVKTFRGQNLGYDNLVYATFEQRLIEVTSKSFPKGAWASGGIIYGHSEKKIDWSAPSAHYVAPKNPVSEASKKLPGMDASVDSPCDCQSYTKYQTSVWSTIQHLNDHHKWTREKVADWIDELHDSGVINAEFESWEEEPLDTDKPVE